MLLPMQCDKCKETPLTDSFCIVHRVRCGKCDIFGSIKIGGKHRAIRSWNEGNRFSYATGKNQLLFPFIIATFIVIIAGAFVATQYNVKHEPSVCVSCTIKDSAEYKQPCIEAATESCKCSKEDFNEIELLRMRWNECTRDLKVAPGKPCGVGFEAALASVKRLLIALGDKDDIHLKRVIKVFRQTCNIAESKRRLKALKDYGL